MDKTTEIQVETTTEIEVEKKKVKRTLTLEPDEILALFCLHAEAHDNAVEGGSAAEAEWHRDRAAVMFLLLPPDARQFVRHEYDYTPPEDGGDEGEENPNARRSEAGTP